MGHVYVNLAEFMVLESNEPGIILNFRGGGVSNWGLASNRNYTIGIILMLQTYTIVQSNAFKKLKRCSIIFGC